MSRFRHNLAGYDNLIALLRTALIAVFAAFALTACGSSVKLDPPTIPRPVMETIPLDVALRMPKNFENYVHEEEVLGRDNWTIDLGRSNAKFIEDLFGYMFENVRVIDESVDPASIPFDALIEPSIDAFEFSVPAQTMTDSFAVWIRYRIKVYDRNGDLVADWPLSAYGKELTTTMGGNDALKAAAVLAMRDAAALMVMKFSEQTLITSLGSPAVQATAVPGGSNEQ